MVGKTRKYAASTCGAESAYPSWNHPGFFSGVRVAKS